MNKQLNPEKLLQAMDWCYDKSLNGIANTPSVYQLADDYLVKAGNNPIKASHELIRYQKYKCATSGFVTGLGGLITLPVAIPANIGSVLYIQIRMAAAIAHMADYDLKSDQVKTFVYMCLAGDSALSICKKVGIRFGTKLAHSTVTKISGKTLIQINKKIGFRLATKFGSKGVVNFGKAIPIAGGLIGGSFDYVTTHQVGKVAVKLFHE